MCDYTNDRAYRMIVENKQAKHRKESQSRAVNLNQAWDDVDYVDLEVVDDFIQKALAIKAGEDYENTVSVPIDLPDDLMMFAFRAAHEADMTLNDWMNQMLRGFIDQVESGEYTQADADRFKLESQGKPWPFEIDPEEEDTKI
jgi:hypothetical protein